MFAIIETGGKQYTVEEGSVIHVEKLPFEEGETVDFDKVLYIGGEEDAKIGKPYVEGAKVQGTVEKQGKNKKVIVYKYKAKKDFHKKKGHRQPYTRVKITGIEG